MGELGNQGITDDVVVKNFLIELEAECVAIKRVNRSLEEKFAQQGEVVNYEKPTMTKTAPGRVFVPQPITQRTGQMVIDYHEHYGLNYTVRDQSLGLDRFVEKHIKSGAKQIGNVIEMSVLDTLALGTPNISWTPGTEVSNTAFTMMSKYMTKVGVPDDGMRSSIINSLDSGVIDIVMSGKYNEAMVKASIQKGYMGPISNVQMYESAQISDHTVGIHLIGAGSTPLSNGTDQTGSSIVTDGWATSTAILNKGDVIQFAGVYEVHPYTRRSTGRLRSFVVTSPVTSDGSGAATIPVSPEINDGTLTTTNRAGDTISLAAYQNVSDPVADGAAITVYGGSGKTYRQNLVFHRDAATLAMVDLMLPETATLKARIRDAETGLALSYTGGYDVTNHREIKRIDAVWGVDVTYPELAWKMFTSEVV